MISTSFLECKNISYSTPDGRILGNNISFSLSGGDLLLITGPNGSGKSTFLHLLFGKLTPQTGTIEWRIKPQKIAFIPQLQESMVHIPLQIHDILKSSLQENFSQKKILDLGLLQEKHLCLSWNQASGGERKRTLLTRLILNNPNILILDEPFNHLDQASREIITLAITKYLQTKKAIAIIVSHEDYWENATKKIKL